MDMPGLMQINRSVCHSNGVDTGYHNLGVMRNDCFANCFRFDSHLADFCFVIFFYFFSGLGVEFKG